MTRPVLIAMAALVLLPSITTLGGLADGPWIQVIEPEADGWVPDPDLVVRGNATPPTRLLSLDPSVLSSGTGQGMVWDGANLTMRPRVVFEEGFGGNQLDLAKWSIIRDVGVIAVEGGRLKLQNVLYSMDFPLIRSVQLPTTRNEDWTARFVMSFAAQYPYSGSGGGISATGTDKATSHMSAYNQYVGWPGSTFSIYGNGQALYNLSWPDGQMHEYRLVYVKDRDVFEVHMDTTKLGTFTTIQTPRYFWFGSTSLGPYAYYSHLDIDQVDLWSFSGSRTLDPVQLDHWSAIEGIDMDWVSNHRADAKVTLEARTSADNVSWDGWTAVDEEGVPTALLEGMFLQLRVNLSLPSVRDANAHISLRGIDVRYNHPITKVELRSNEGEWVDATGLEQWRGQVRLVEDANTVEVRVTDTSGAFNVTSFDQLLDTTPPVGTMEILKDSQYTNDLNVTLHLNATDRYGVEYVQVSNSPDMRGRVTFPYVPSLAWQMVGSEGVVTCWVRFIDSHGLMSQVVSDSIMYDSIPPSGRVAIEGGKGYTASLTVDLELEHSDTRGVARVELSNLANMSRALVVEPTETMVTGWTLLEGDDGPRTVHMRLTDVAGNVRVVSDSIELYRPKALGGLTVEEGAEITSKSVVDVAIDVPYEELKPRLLQLSNEPAFIDATWESVERAKRWILSSGDGEKTVYLRFLDFRDIISLAVNTTIVLDTTPPEVVVLLNEGAVYTTEPLVGVELQVTDASPLVTMWASTVDRFNEVDPRSFEPRFQWEVLAREGVRNLYVKVMDLAGNEGVGHSSIHYATISPEIRLELPDGSPSSARDNVSVKVVWIDHYGGVEVKLALDQDPPDGAPWLPVDGTLPLAIPPGLGDGWHEVHAVARNAAGLRSEVVTARVRLDRTAPSVEIMRPKDGSTLSQKGLEVLLEVEASDATGISQVSYRVDEGPWRVVPRANLTTVVTLERFGDVVIEVELTDGAGNTAAVTTSFRLEEEGARVGAGISWAILLLVLVLVAAVLLAHQLLGRRAAGHPMPWERHGRGGEEGSRSGPDEMPGVEPPVAAIGEPGAPSNGGGATTPEPPSSVDDGGLEWQEF